MSLIRPNAGWPAMSAPMKPGEWFVLHTGARQEKILARQLNEVGITAYVLMIRQTRQYDRQVLDVEVPLFKRVVFLHGSAEDVSFARGTGRVISVARATDQLGLEADFAHLAATLPSDAPALAESESGVEPKPSRRLPATLEPHRPVIVRLRKELDSCAQALKMR